MSAFFSAAVRFRLLILAVAIGVMTVGVVQLRSAPVDVLPEFTPPYAEIQTEALGLSAEEVEQLITVPLEADLLNGVEGVDVIRSESVPGLSSIVLVFAEGTDVYRARQLVGERLTQAHALPNVSRPPTLLQPLSSSNRVLMIGLSSSDLSPIEQSVIARWTVRPRLMGVPGVANVSVWGMRDQQLQVQVDPARLRDQGVTLSQVIESAGNAQVVSPLTFLEASTPGTGGFIETPQQRLQVRHLLEKIADPAELGNVPVAETNGRLRLSDVADVKIDHQPLIGDAVVAGGTGLLLVVEKFPGTSTLAVTEGVEAALETLRPGLAGIATDTSIFRPADYIEDALGNIGLALVAGGLLMLLALLALRFHWRAVLITLVTVPLSLVTAGLVLHLLGQGMNALVFAGLAAALAVIVDEAITPTHRVMNRLRERRQAADAPASLSGVIVDASSEVRRPLVYATLICLLAILPLAVLGGRPGDFFSSLVLAYVVAVAAATLVALTLTPALTVLLFATWPATKQESAVSRHVGARYVTTLQRFSRSARPFVIVGVALTLIALAIVPFLGLSLLPTFRDRNVVVELEAEPGTSNPRMTELTTGVADQLAAIPGVANVAAHIGRAVTGDRVTNVSSSQIWVSIDSDADYSRTIQAIEDAAAAESVVESSVLTYSTAKMREVGALNEGQNSVTGTDLDLLTGLSSPVAVRLFGQDPEIMAEQAEQVRELMEGVDGVRDPRVVTPTAQPTIEIEVDLERAQALGVTPGDVRRAEATLLQGIQVGSVFEQQKVFDVIVQGVPSARASVDQVRNLLIDRPGGGHLLLGDVADVRVVDTPSVIRRDAVSRRLDVVADVDGRSVDAVAADIEAQLADVAFPLEYHAEVLQGSTDQEIGAGRVIGFAVTAVIAAFLLLQAAFQSWRLALLVALVLPASLSGGLVVALIDGAELTIGSLLGLLTVFALATRWSILLVTDLISLEREPDEAGTRPGATLVHHGSRSRFAPVALSAVALVTLMLPFAILSSTPGFEIVHSMALVVIGGLVTTTIVTLLLLPALYLHLAPRVPPRDLTDRPSDPDAPAPPRNERDSGRIDSPDRQPAAVGAQGTPSQR